MTLTVTHGQLRALIFRCLDQDLSFNCQSSVLADLFLHAIRELSVLWQDQKRYYGEG